MEIKNKITAMKKQITLILFLASFLVIILSVYTSCDVVGTGIPVLVSPIDGSTITQNPPTFIWQSIEDIDEYWLEVSDNSSFIGSIVSITCYADTTYTPYNSFDAGTYFWRVCAGG